MQSSNINDEKAKNLISQLLNQDPCKRISMDQVLNHPFITGKSPARMTGDTAEFDVFISYRVG